MAGHEYEYEKKVFAIEMEYLSVALSEKSRFYRRI
jgi:hypothetical protein